MSFEMELPVELKALAERETWYSQQDAKKVLDWLEGEDLTLLGIDTAEKLPDGNWILRLDPMLVTPLGDSPTPDDSAETRTQSRNIGRSFVAEHSDLMFELVWPGY